MIYHNYHCSQTKVWDGERWPYVISLMIIWFIIYENVMIAAFHGMFLKRESSIYLSFARSLKTKCKYKFTPKKKAADADKRTKCWNCSTGHAASWIFFFLNQHFWLMAFHRYNLLSPHMLLTCCRVVTVFNFFLLGCLFQFKSIQWFLESTAEFPICHFPSILLDCACGLSSNSQKLKQIDSFF